jgi:hypothetical protein
VETLWPPLPHDEELEAMRRMPRSLEDVDKLYVCFLSINENTWTLTLYKDLSGVSTGAHGTAD